MGICVVEVWCGGFGGLGNFSNKWGHHMEMGEKGGRCFMLLVWWGSGFERDGTLYGLVFWGNGVVGGGEGW